MIKYTAFLTLLCLFISPFAEGAIFNGPKNLTLRSYDTLSINGPANLKLVKAGSIEIKGDLQFHSLDVSGNAEIKGILKGDKGKFGSLDVHGTVDVDHVICGELHVQGPVKAAYLIVKDHAEIMGPLDAQHGKFKSLTISAERAILEDVTVENITIQKGQKNQTLILKGPSVVNGDIIFEAGDGIVQIQSPEVQIKGQIKGAKIKKD